MKLTTKQLIVAAIFVSLGVAVTCIAMYIDNWGRT